MSVFNASLTMMNQGDSGSSEWQPLNDGYSNFWFELTNDTLSPWLRFSKKNSDAVIDWGDGSGEQALTTLTPTHTYSKAGKYVVKVKGVTGIGRQHTAPYTNYTMSLVAVETNSDVTSIANSAFNECNNLKNVDIGSVTSIGTNAFAYCASLQSITFSSAVTNIGNGALSYCFSLRNVTMPMSSITALPASMFYYCRLLNNITIPSNISSIGYTAFFTCSSLSEVHVQATTPPTLGTNVFGELPANWICYVPVGTAETYKAASGWSTYADHILEEGQQPNRAMLAKFGSAGLGEEDEKPNNEEMR